MRTNAISGKKADHRANHEGYEVTPYNSRRLVWRRAWVVSEPFAKFGRVRELLPGRVVPPGSAGVPPACSSFPCFRRRLRGSTRIQAAWMHRIFSGKGCLAFLSIRKPAPDHRGSNLTGAAGPLPVYPAASCASRFIKTIDSPVPLPLGPSGGEGQAVPIYGAGGTPALPGGLPPMRASQQGDKIAGAFRDRLSLKEVHPYLCLFVSIRGSSLLTATCFTLG